MHQLLRTRWAVAALGAAFAIFALAWPAMAQHHGGHHSGHHGSHHGGHRGGHHGGHHGGHSSFGIHIGGFGGYYGGNYYDRYYARPQVYYYEAETYQSAPAPPRYSGAPITISNLKGSAGGLTYHLNQWTFTIKPGESQKIKHDRDWVIRFDRGKQQGSAEYSLTGGLYTAKQTPDGWDLFTTNEKKDAPPAPPVLPK